MTRRRAIVALALVAMLAASGCQTTDADKEGPQTSAEGQLANLNPGQRPSVESDEAGLWMTMDKAEENLRTAGNRILDPALNDYVHGVACKVAAAYCKDIRVYILRVPYFNAMMAPNGSLQIWSGLLLRARNEAQLAAVLGHEIGHYLRRHSLQRMREVRGTAGFLVFFQIATGAVGVPAAGSLASLAAMASVMSFSRDNEREADAVGLRLMAKAGYDPRETADIWRRLIAEENADKENAPTRSIFFATHPDPEERLETLDKLAKETIGNGPPGVVNDAQYQAAIGPFRASFLRDETYSRQYARLQKMIDMMLADGRPKGELLYFRGEVYRQKGEKDDLKKAVEAYDESIATGRFLPEIYRSLGLVYQKLGESAKAKDAFATYLRLRPDAEDRQMIRSMMEQIS